MKYLLLLMSCYLSIYAQDNHAIELEYYLTLNENEFLESPVYLEKNVIEGYQKYTLATLHNSAEDIIKENEENNSTMIYPKLLYRLRYDYNEKVLEAHEPIILRSANMTELFAIIDTVSDLKWNITEQSKNLEGYKCILATTEFRCREYHAWFAPDIPISYGPWKLHGLPGLIVEAYDKEKFRRYTLGKYSKIQKKDPFINEIKNGEIIEKLPISRVSEYYTKIDENFKAKRSIGNAGLDCLNCPNTETKIKINTWECY